MTESQFFGLNPLRRVFLHLLVELEILLHAFYFVDLCDLIDEKPHLKLPRSQLELAGLDLLETKQFSPVHDLLEVFICDLLHLRIQTGVDCILQMSDQLLQLPVRHLDFLVDLVHGLLEKPRSRPFFGSRLDLSGISDCITVSAPLLRLLFFLFRLERLEFSHVDEAAQAVLEQDVHDID